jgi:hypothetical protein
VELTVCFEDNFADAKARKEAKYADLVDEIEGNGFIVDLITVEVGSRGFVKYMRAFATRMNYWVLPKKSYTTS